MKGEVDNSGRAMVMLSVRTSADSEATRLAAWVESTIGCRPF